MDTYHSIFAALADPTRRALFETLKGRPSSVGKLAAEFPVSRPAVSQHLKVLKAARLVTEQPRGTKRIYAVDPEGLASLREYVETFWDDLLQAFAEKVKEETGASP